jgi:predicted nucleic acid-binding protein
VTEVFADAFYYIALLNPADRFHAAAIQATQDLHQPLVTTAWILMEVADALCAPVVRQRTHRFLQRVTTDPQTSLIADHMPWFTRGMQLYGNRYDKLWSLTDCISFSVMTERGITDALTGDQHFVQAGFRALLLSPDSSESDRQR